jgi:hypothetical protein
MTQMTQMTNAPEHGILTAIDRTGSWISRHYGETKTRGIDNEQPTITISVIVGSYR